MNEFLYEIANIPFHIKGLKSNIVPSRKAFSGETSSVFFKKKIIYLFILVFWF